ncbi:hypothetical protein LJR290_005917 [Variovorax sp. LjRoot290]|uniref:hypothetical protein n=1 Tax=Variovorax sp. LjRoot290 TaxID=3342316 RepID=UPI003ECEA92B
MATNPFDRTAALETLSASDLLKEGDAVLLRNIRPLLSDLIGELRALPQDATQERRLQTFEQALRRINRYEDQIETVEREAILEAIYRIGAAVGLDPDSQFAERWRGDW